MITPNLGNALKAVGRAADAVLTGREVFVAPAKRKARLQACARCPQLDPGGQCKVCTCWVSNKSRLATETCPEGKWPA